MKKINEVSRMTGVTKRALQYYDNLGILPVRRSKDNYRLYDDEDLERVWEILIYRNLEFGLEEIGRLTRVSEEERDAILEKKLEDKKRELEDLEARIEFLNVIKRQGLPPVCFRENNEFLTYVGFIRLSREAFHSKAEKEERLDSRVRLDAEFLSWVEQNFGKDGLVCLIRNVNNYLWKEGKEHEE